VFKLNEKRFADFFRAQPETGMGYTIVTTVLKNGKRFPQTIVTGGVVSRVRGFSVAPFSETDIDCFEVTHDKWDWRKDN
jgi:hypothetical protein